MDKEKSTLRNYFSRRALFWPVCTPVSYTHLINVNSRIRLLFGEQYGVTIYSTEGVGTDVEVTLPRITGKSKDYTP